MNGYIDRSVNFAEILSAHLTRRQVLQTGLATTLTLALPFSSVEARRAATGLGFKSIPVSSADLLEVPEGYEARVLFRWGDPVGSTKGMPEFKLDATNSADDQVLQAGMHHDGMHYFPMPYGSTQSTRALLAINHEYADEGLLFPDGMKTWSAEKVKKAQQAVGVSIIEVEWVDGAWRVVRPSRYARRIHAATPMRLSGPAAGSAWVKTVFDTKGVDVLGTYANCANGYTPWGTYLTCEENWQGAFVNGGSMPEHHRYGVSARGFGMRWNEFEPRFDAGVHPFEPNRFGWVVEIDPYDPDAKPVKRTALGRCKHEGAWPSVAPDGRVAFYMGDDEAFEYIYKFVTSRPYQPKDRAANRDLLDHGTLYVAKFSADGSGEWLPLVHNKRGLTPTNGFTDQAEVLVKTRQAADFLGATRMDRPEWVAVHPVTREVYCTLTNNSERGGTAGKGTDAANPRHNNIFGHIIRWKEEGNDPTATRFQWNIFALCGDGSSANENLRGRFKGDAFGSPDGLWFDPRGVLWVQTDVSARVLNQGAYAPLGNNQMLAYDFASGEFKRFLTGPRGCEVTGVAMAPDLRSLFINIQHPGELGGDRNDPDLPRKNSNWPDYHLYGRPRSATVVIRKKDGGIIGT